MDSKSTSSIEASLCAFLDVSVLLSHRSDALDVFGYKLVQEVEEKNKRGPLTVRSAVDFFLLEFLFEQRISS